MPKIILGRKYQVTIGSGLKEGKVGVAVNYQKHRQLIDRKSNGHFAEYGRYKDFDPKTEQVLMGENGQIFTMFKSRLKEIN